MKKYFISTVTHNEYGFDNITNITLIHLILLKIAKSFKMYDFLGVAENTEKYIFCFYIIFFA